MHCLGISMLVIQAQPPRKLTTENISRVIEGNHGNPPYDSSRPGYHLIPKAGFMGDPNGGLYSRDGTIYFTCIILSAICRDPFAGAMQGAGTCDMGNP